MARLEMRKFAQHIHAVCTYVATPDFGETLAEVMEPSYWAHVAPLIKASMSRPNAHVDIEIRPVGNPYYARLVVLRAEQNFVETKLVQFTDLTGEQAIPKQRPMVKDVVIGKYKAERNGAWVRVIRLEDKVVMKTGLRTIEEAQEWASENLNVSV